MCKGQSQKPFSRVQAVSNWDWNTSHSYQGKATCSEYKSPLIQHLLMLQELSSIDPRFLLKEKQIGPKRCSILHCCCIHKPADEYKAENVYNKLLTAIVYCIFVDTIENGNYFTMQYAIVNVSMLCCATRCCILKSFLVNIFQHKNLKGSCLGLLIELLGMPCFIQ